MVLYMFLIRMVANIWITMFSIYKLKVEIRGKEQMQSNRPFVIVCNHQSGLDVISEMTDYSPRPVCYLLQ